MYKIQFQNCPKVTTAKFDSGASRSCLSRRVFETLSPKPKLSKQGLELVSASGTTLDVLGSTEITFRVNKKVYREVFSVIDGLNSDCLLGLTWQRKYRICTGWSRTGQHFLSTQGEVIATSIQNGKLVPTVKTKGAVKVPAYSVSVLEVAAPPNITSSTGYIVDAAEGLEGFVPLETVHKFDKTPRTLKIPVLNYTNKEITIPKKTHLGKLHNLEDKVDAISETSWKQLRTNFKEEKLPQIPRDTIMQFTRQFRRPDVELPDAENAETYKKKVNDMLASDFCDIVSTGPTDIGRTKLHEADIQYEGDPVSVRPFTIPLKYQKFVDEEILRLEEAGLISKSMSDFNSPLIVVPKKADKDKPGELQLRMVIDYRQVNKNIRTSRDKSGKVVANFPIPNIDNLLSKFQGARFFSAIDIRSAYHHIGLTEKSRQITAFSTHSGKYEWSVLPFGINIAVQTWSYLITKALGVEASKFTAVFLDDILIYSKTADEHLRHIRVVFDKLKKANLKIKPSKCDFFKKQVNFLGHVVSNNGISSDPDKVEALKNFKTPTDQKQLRHFLGLAGFYRKFIDKYADITYCLYKLLGKKTEWIWTPQCDAAIEVLKEELGKNPIMIHPSPDKTYHLQTDASNTGYSGILQQPRDNNPKELAPVAYFSGTFKGAQLRWSTSEKEGYAIYKSVNKFAFYIAGCKCICHTDHKPLKPFFEQGMKNTKLDRWSLQLQDYDLEFSFVKGSDNVLADSLSRLYLQDKGLYTPNEKSSDGDSCLQSFIEEVSDDFTEDRDLLHDLLVPANPINVSLLIEKQKRDEKCKQLIASNHPSVYLDEFQVLTKIVKVQDEAHHLPVLPSSLVHQVIFALHDRKGHQGTQRTTYMLRRMFWISNAKSIVHNYIRNCNFCKKFAPNLNKYKTLHLPVTTLPYQGISMDLIGKLPTSPLGNKYALTVIDMFSNYLIAVPLQDKKADTVVKAYLDAVYSKHGSSEWILSDNGKEFKCSTMKDVCKRLRIEHRHTNVYYPRGNARIENVHNFLKRTIAKYTVTYSDLSWDTALQLACFAFNTSESADGLKSPYFLLHGRHPRDNQFKDLELSQNYLGDNDSIIRLKALRKIWLDHAKHITEHRQSKAARINKTRQPLPTFKVGDKVLIRNHTRAQFEPKYCDGYTVVRQINPTTLKVQKGKSSTRVNVHHVKKSSERQPQCQPQPQPQRQPQPPQRDPYNLRSRNKTKS